MSTSVATVEPNTAAGADRAEGATEGKILGGMIYTCFEMVRDCRANRAEGWSYFVSNYVPVIRKLLAHYASEESSLVEGVLVAIAKPESSVFQSLEPAPERWFVAELRQNIHGQIQVDTPEITIDLETVAAALEPLTVVEKQAAWLETMGYDSAASGAMLRMAPRTVEKIRGRASELIRGAIDNWRHSLLAENGVALGRAAAAGAGKDCLPAKSFLDMIDGRATWRVREEMERHITACWHCIDHFCRMAEVIGLLRGIEPLSEAEAEPFLRPLGIRGEKRARWKRWLGGGA